MTLISKLCAEASKSSIERFYTDCWNLSSNPMTLTGTLMLKIIEYLMGKSNQKIKI